MSHKTTPLFTHTHMYIYTIRYIYIYNLSYMISSEPMAFALVSSQYDDNWEWFMGAVAGNGILHQAL